MTYKVVVSGSAEQDIRDVYRWLLKRLPFAAAGWYKNLRAAIASLESFPLRCPIAEECADEFPDARHLLCGNPKNRYRIFFRVHDDVVYILRIVHGARAETPFE